jgi:hypothetical protein
MDGKRGLATYASFNLMTPVPRKGTGNVSSFCEMHEARRNVAARKTAVEN